MRQTRGNYSVFLWPIAETAAGRETAAASRRKPMNPAVESAMIQQVAATQPRRRLITSLLQCSNLGGMEKVAYGLLEQLQTRGFEVRVTTPRPWGLGRSRLAAVDPNAQAFPYRGKFGFRSFPAFYRQARAVCAAAERVWVIGTCVSCLMAARLTGKKTLLSHHYHHFEGPRARLRWTAFYLAFGRWLDGITYPTEFTRDEALRIAPWLKGKTHVVRNGFDIRCADEAQRVADQRAARQSLGIPLEAFVIGNAGWLIPRKRFDVFLKTAYQVSRQCPDAQFQICGGGSEEGALRQLAHELGIARQVHFAGWVQDLAPYYRAWDAVLFNSDFDALGCTPLEAASYGCPCVASVRYGGLSEFLEDGRTGFLFREHNAEDLAGALVGLARETELASRIRRQAWAKLKRDFSHGAALQFYENYFDANRPD
jgi:glycosyltransferase involved in cell wall biosynthesis